MSPAILYSEVSMVCILFLLLICLKTKNSVFLQSQWHGFLAVVISNMILFSLDVVWIFVDNKKLPMMAAGNWLLNGAYYAMSGLAGYIWFCYSEMIQQSRFVKDKKWRIAAFIPELVLIILTILSVQNHLLFYIDENNLYHRGPFYSVQVILAYGYTISTAVKAFVLSIRTNDYRRKMELRALSTFILPTIVAGSLQIFFPRYPILCVGTTFGIMYIYMTMQEQLISRDPLTQLNNRNQLYQYLSVKIRHVQKDKPLFLIIIDINKFKSINDTYGHIEGDRALRLVADCLKKACSEQNFFISRYGGDEFIIICELAASQSIENVCESIHSGLREIDVPYSLTVSIGCAQYNYSIKTQQEFISLADKQLYKVKRQC